MAVSGRIKARLATAAVFVAMIASACGGTVALDFPVVEDGSGVGGGGASSPLCSRLGEVACGATCAPLASDPANCGACAVVCGGQTPYCNVGLCASSCRTELTACANGCVDLTSDVHDCGACGATCALSQSCIASRCACPSGTLLCAGTCVDVMTDTANCGVCGVTCRGGTPLCDRGICSAVCSPGLKVCAGTCVDPSSVRCNPTSCDGGSCPCATSLTSCAGTCVDTRTNAMHCGSCGLACAIGLSCKGGRCQP